MNKLNKIEENKIIEKYINGEKTSYIAKQFNINIRTICSIRKKYGIKNRQRLPSFGYRNDNYFEKINTKEKAYFLGLIVADGSIGKSFYTTRIELKKEDSYILEKLSNIIYKENKVKLSKNKKYSTLKIGSKKIFNDLARLNIHPKKSFNADPNLSAFNDELMKSFILGVFDGDGSIYLRKWKGKEKIFKSLQCKIMLSPEMFASFEKYVKEKLDIRINKEKVFSKVDPNNYICAFNIDRKKDALSFFKWLYEKEPIFLTRKKEIFLNYDEISNQRQWKKKTI